MNIHPCAAMTFSYFTWPQVRSVALRALLLVATAALVSACGGGGQSSANTNTNPTVDSSSWQSGVYLPADSYRHYCAQPRLGASIYTGIPFPDRKGTQLDEKNWLRSWSHETYLWYREIKDTNPNNSQTPQDYFKGLVTTALTPNGQKKDKFHFTRSTAEVEQEYESGSVSGYGLGLSFIANTPPRQLIVAYVEAASPAANAGITRGLKIVSVDGVDLVNTNSSAGIDTLNNGLFPADIGEVHSFGVEDAQGQRRTVSLQSADVITNPVLQRQVITQGASKLGYMVFNRHIPSAETQLYDAINYFAAEGVDDLVLDLRYNGGGLLQIAAGLGYMIAGPKSVGKTFEQLVFNDQYAPDTPFEFQNVGAFGVTKWLALPTLNLSRVFILSTDGTCSASESIINGLRGIGVEVVLIGGQTCGNPYGFYSTDNCGTTYYTIQFSGVNAKGFGDYSDGFIPSATDNTRDKVKGCAVADDFSAELGNPQEGLLSAALSFRATGTCGVSQQAKQQKPSGILQPDAGVSMELDNAWLNSKVIPR